MSDFLSLRLAATSLNDATIPNTPQPYSSCRLNREKDSTRLITVDPKPDASGRLVCHLKTVRFDERPKFTALSYRWGDETNNQTIVVNGHDFSVTANLHDALEYLRDSLPGEQLWIDAIVINQGDIPEKNYQLFILPDIYKRAKGIVSWLSKEFSGLVLDTTSLNETQADMELRRKIHADEYWQRAWVLQEVGNARKVRVCIGPGLLDWDLFITWMTYGMPKEKQKLGPMRLEDLRQERFTLSMQLKRLIEDYSSYKCTDPRDKIYSLVGLSSDGSNLPMDYGRSLVDVWSDVVGYLWSNKTLNSRDEGNVEFCKMLRETLGGQKLGSPSGIVSFQNTAGEQMVCEEDDDETQPTDPSLPPLVHVLTNVVGTVVSLGPSPLEIATSLELARDWKRNLYETFHGIRDDTPQSIAEENEPLMDAILDSEDGRIAATSSYTTWRVDQVSYDGIYKKGTSYVSEDGAPVEHPKLKHSWSHQTTTPEEPRLAIMKRGYCGDWEYETENKIVLVPADAQIGDRMVQVSDSTLKLFMCHPYDTGDGRTCRLHLYGTAKTAGQITGTKELQGTPCTTVTYMHPKTYYALMFDDLEGTK